MMHKLKIAWFVFTTQGWSALWREVRAFLRGSQPPQVDECKVAFEALNASQNRGVMLDVGAHFGGSLMPFARCGWKIFAFEPDSANRRRLELSVPSLDVTIDPRAVSDRSQKKVALFRSASSSGISGLSAFHESHRPFEEVDVVTLADYIDEHTLLRGLDFLKIDTEGFDLPVLRGFPWKECRPKLILCEFEDAKTVPLGYTFRDLADYLVDRDYRLVVSEWYPIERYGTAHRWRRFVEYPCDLEDAKGWGNVLAARDDALYASILRACGLRVA